MSDAETKEWANVFGVKVKIPCDMPDDIFKFSIDLVKEQLKDIDISSREGEESLQKIKNAMDSAWEPNWHVVVGKNFGSKVNHEVRKFIFFYYQDYGVMIYKA